MKKRYNFTIEEKTHDLLKKISEKENRPLSNMIEVLINQYVIDAKKNKK